MSGAFRRRPHFGRAGSMAASAGRDHRVRLCHDRLGFQQYLADVSERSPQSAPSLCSAAVAVAAAGAGTAFGAHRAPLRLPLAAPGPRSTPRRWSSPTTFRANWLTFDPGWIYEINSAAGHVLDYEPLYDLPDSTKPTEFEPLLAAELPQVSEDGLEVVIPLRPGVKFHSGNEMTADDLVFSWNRLKNIKFQVISCARLLGQRRGGRSADP